MPTAAGRPSDGIIAVQSSDAQLPTSETTEEIENTILKTYNTSILIISISARHQYLLQK